MWLLHDRARTGRSLTVAYNTINHACRIICRRFDGRFVVINDVRQFVAVYQARPRPAIFHCTWIGLVSFLILFTTQLLFSLHCVYLTYDEEVIF